MSGIRHGLSCLLAGSMLAASATALQWQKTNLSITTAPFQRTGEAVFEFKNASAKPVTIVGLETNCDCLEAAAVVIENLLKLSDR